MRVVHGLYGRGIIEQLERGDAIRHAKVIFDGERCARRVKQSDLVREPADMPACVPDRGPRLVHP